MKVTNVVVFCAGPQSKVIIDALEDQPEYHIIGIIDSVMDIESHFYGYKIIGRQSNLAQLSEIYDFNSGVVGLGDNYLREKVVLEILAQKKAFNFVNVISKFAYVSKTAIMGVGNVILHGAVVNSEAQMGNHCVINTKSSLDHNCSMDDYASFGANIVTGGFVKIGRYSAITLAVTIFDRLEIGENVVVGSGSLVTKDLESNSLYYGVPAKRIRDRKPSERFLK